MNLHGYDMILDMPWIYQHKVAISLNLLQVIVGSSKAVSIKKGIGVTRPSSQAMKQVEHSLDQIREELRHYTKLICKSATNTPLPPLCTINHEILIIDESVIYSWRPSRCPEALRSLWDEKQAAYIKTGCWKVTASGNAISMIFLKKPEKPGEPIRLRSIIDLQARNANTYKKSSLLPDMDRILKRTAGAKYRLIINGQDVYEQICIKPEHISRTTVTTLDGNMVSHVIQQGDCNTPATY